MISEQDKKAILNGAWFITTESFIKRAKLISIREGEYPYVVIEERHKGDKVIDDDDLPYIVNAWPSLGAIGLWQDKPEPFDLARALNGEPVLLRCGLKAHIKFKLDNVSDERDALCGYIVQRDGKTAVMSWKENGGANYGNVENNDDIIGMWKEPKPQLSSNSLQLPKPLTDVPNDNDEVWHFFTARGCHANCSELSIRGLKWGKDISKEAELEYLNHGRLYATREDVVKVIEAITGKPYVE